MQSEMEADGGEWAEDEEEKAEAGEEEKERGVMPEDEEVKAEGGEVEKKTFQCMDCDKKYAFLHKLKNHQVWSCKGKEGEKLEIDVARRAHSSNVFCVKSKGEDPVDAEPVGANPSKVDFLKCTYHSLPEYIFQKLIFTCNLCLKPLESKNAIKNHKRRFHKVRVVQNEVIIILNIFINNEILIFRLTRRTMLNNPQPPLLNLSHVPTR